MALQKDMQESRFDFLVKGAYIKFSYLRWSDIDMRAVATFSTFATKKAREEEKEAISSFEIDVTNIFGNIQLMIYSALKNTEEYKDAIDV